MAQNRTVGNGFGRAAGFLQVRELGNIETSIVLTNTLSVGAGTGARAFCCGLLTIGEFSWTGSLHGAWR